MALRFVKMHGLGNDYVFIDAYEQTVRQPAELARAVSDRHCGVGSDGLILIAPPDDPAAHVRMIVFNADGTRAEMCGNGIRCVGKYAYERGRARHNPLRVQTDAGVLTLELCVNAEGHVDRVRVDMGRPMLDPRRIPVAVDGDHAVGVPVEIVGHRLAATCVSLGNPHTVFFVDDLAAVPLDRWGPALERHPLFPNRTNVHFAKVLSPRRVRMITWERGSGTTRACGTGACAVCVAGVLNDVTERRLVAELPGGELELRWDAVSDHVFMTGPACEVFTGVWPCRPGRTAGT